MTITVTLTEQEVGWIHEGIEAICHLRKPRPEEQRTMAVLKDKLTTDRRDTIRRALFNDSQKNSAELDHFNTIVVAHYYAKHEGYLVTDVLAGKKAVNKIATISGRMDYLRFGDHMIPILIDPFAPPNRLSIRMGTDLFDYTIDPIGGEDEET